MLSAPFALGRARAGLPINTMRAASRRGSRCTAHHLLPEQGKLPVQSGGHTFPRWRAALPRPPRPATVPWPSALVWGSAGDAVVVAVGETRAEALRQGQAAAGSRSGTVDATVAVGRAASSHAVGHVGRVAEALDAALLLVAQKGIVFSHAPLAGRKGGGGSVTVVARARTERTAGSVVGLG
jgi:hypothetical protein